MRIRPESMKQALSHWSWKCGRERAPGGTRKTPMKMPLAPTVSDETSDPPTTPRAVPGSVPGLTTLMSHRHAGELPARHVEDLAVHVVRPRRAEEEDAAGGLLGRAGAAERDEHRGHAPHLLRDAELHLLAADLR